MKWTILTIFLGLVVGSFLNVVVARLPEGKSIAWPGSHCPKCRAPIRWWDNIPVLSYLALRGQCRNCHERISLRYPVIELLTALLFLAAKIRFGWTFALVIRDFPFLAMLVAVTFIDLEHRIIPDELSLGGLVWGILTSVLFSVLPIANPAWGGLGVTSWLNSLMGAATGFGLFYSLAWLYHRFAKKQGLGGGDIKFIAMLGSFVGVMGVFSTILISSLFGSVIGIVWGFFQHRAALKEGGARGLLAVSIPYGPFLVIGALYYYLLGDILWFPFMTQI